MTFDFEVDRTSTIRPLIPILLTNNSELAQKKAPSDSLGLPPIGLEP